ncbi:MAG: hypothetical protein M0R22_07335 [Dehalococcoidia bacterium]|jgi:hypothetical protein|nr:hypothetical protein [Dehalococcoidia bacterium]
MAFVVTFNAETVDLRVLPAIPELAPLLVKDADEELQQAFVEYVAPVMRDYNSDGDGPEPLAFYADMAIAFEAGFEAGRATTQRGSEETPQEPSGERTLATASS